MHANARLTHSDSMYSLNGKYMTQFSMDAMQRIIYTNPPTIYIDVKMH